VRADGAQGWRGGISRPRSAKKIFLQVHKTDFEWFFAVAPIGEWTPTVLVSPPVTVLLENFMPSMPASGAKTSMRYRWESHAWTCKRSYVRSVT
jgi:hypothetical protein